MVGRWKESEVDLFTSCFWAKLHAVLSKHSDDVLAAVAGLPPPSLVVVVVTIVSACVLVAIDWRGLRPAQPTLDVDDDDDDDGGLCVTVLARTLCHLCVHARLAGVLRRQGRLSHHPQFPVS